MRRNPLPPELSRQPFSVREALAAGIPPGRLRSLDLERSVWGMRSAGELHGLRSRVVLFQARLREDAVLSHATAAMLYGAPLPPAIESSTLIDVSVPSPALTPHARAIRGHSVTLTPADCTVYKGVRVTSAGRTWVDLGAVLELGDLVAVGDFFVHMSAPYVRLPELRARVLRGDVRRGIRRLREAVGLLSDRAESRPESLLRVLVVVAGLPAPRANYSIVDADTGREVRLDLVFEAEKVVLEYQGDYHRTRQQWRKDMTRRSRVESQGWCVIELNADDLHDPVELVARIAAVLARRR